MAIQSAPLRAENLMTDGWELLERVIRRGDVADIAAMLNVSEDIVHRWMRRPLTTDDPDATGRRNPIDYFLRLLNAVYLRNPEGAAEIVERVERELARLKGTHGQSDKIPIDEIEDRLREIAHDSRWMADSIRGAKQ